MWYSLVDGVGVVLVELVDALLELGAARRLVDRQVEQLDVRVQRELVHRVDAAHVVEHEEEDRRARRARTVALEIDKVFSVK